MDYCDCGAMLSSFSPDGVHCLACSEALTRRGEARRPVRLEELFQEFCRGLQAVILAGADVRTTIDGCSCGVIEVEVHELGIMVHCITAASPVEQCTLLAPEAIFTVAFVDG